MYRCKILNPIKCLLPCRWFRNALELLFDPYARLLPCRWFRNVIDFGRIFVLRLLPCRWFRNEPDIRCVQEGSFTAV